MDLAPTLAQIIVLLDVRDSTPTGADARLDHYRRLERLGKGLDLCFVCGQQGARMRDAEPRGDAHDRGLVEAIRQLL
jgi:hypothetical protein